MMFDSKKGGNQAAMLIDSHAHLDMHEFDRDREQVLDRALQNGITKILTIGIDLPSSISALQLAKSYDFVFSSVGYHPHNANELDSNILRNLGELASEPEVVAWGEIGLDFYRKHSSPKNQKNAFNLQLENAAHFDLPLIIHIRDAHEEALDILKGHGKKSYSGVIHCFSGDHSLARQYMDLGFYISIPGTVTYKNATQIQDVARKMPLDKMLLETDAPFLTPSPKRGKRNEPSYVRYTARKIADLRGIEVLEIAEQTSENAKRLFGLPG